MLVRVDDPESKEYVFDLKDQATFKPLGIPKSTRKAYSRIVAFHGPSIVSDFYKCIQWLPHISNILLESN